MSEFLAAAASTMNVPEALVQRSAVARAKATGASVEDVLQAWAGGAAAPASAPPVAVPAPESAAEPPPVPAAPETDHAPAAGVPAPPAAEPAPVAAAVVVLDEPEEEVSPPAPVRERIRVAGRIGMGFGLLAAVFVMVFSAQWLLPKAGVAPSDTGDVSFAFSVLAGSLILGSALVGLVVGGVGGAFTRAVAAWRSSGMRLVSSHTVSVVAGAVVGLVVGVLVAAVLVGSGTPDPLDETVTVVPALSAVIWTLLGWVGGGWLIGTIVQAVGVPAGLDESEAEEGVTVQRRLTAAFSLPVVAAVSILLLVLPAAWVFIQFPAWAPFIAIFISGGVLAFAGLSAARPGMRISAGEFLVAVAGIAVVVLIVVAVLSTQGGGHDEEGDHGGEAALGFVTV